MFQINGDLDLSIISNLSFWGCLWGILSLKTLIWSQGHFHAWVKVWASITQKRNALFPETLNSAKIFKTCIFCACIFLFIISDFWSILFIFGQFKDKGIFWGLLGCRFMRKWKKFWFPLHCSWYVQRWWPSIKSKWHIWHMSRPSFPYHTHLIKRQKNQCVDEMRSKLSRPWCPYHILVRI